MKADRLYLVFTDLDGTLLDHTNYSYTGSLRGIAILKERGIPLILVSSKTFPEIAAISGELNLRSPMIFENGGGIAYPGRPGSAGDFHTELTGYSIPELRQRLPILEGLLGLSIKTMFEMPVDEIAGRTGLLAEKAALALERKTSVPFILPPGTDYGLEQLEKINRKLHNHKLMMTRGGRFYHFSSMEANKGDAIHRIIAFYKKNGRSRKIVTLGIGDSENDIPMLRSVTHPFLVRKPDGSSIETGIKLLKVTGGIGPVGFTEAIEGFFG